ncbi:MAG TPA: cation:dicarboxylase symporter family transporter [Rhabdochlamydiaceae bacterium]|nr:cation:dicarboxylase symporter family transporter [Rhabdochlamydiaceae bacterium]
MTERLSFPLQMAIATFLGIFVGLFFGEKAAILSPWADAYIMILKITAIPYLIVAIVHGIGLLNIGTAKQILKKGALFIAIAISINITMIYLIKWVFPAGKGGAPISYVLKEVSPLDFANLLIPDNIFSDLSNNIVPAIVVFSLLVGIALMSIAEKQSVMLSLETVLKALTRITHWIARITPFGTFIIMANQMGTAQFHTIKQMATYIILYILGTGLVVFWIGPRLVSMLTNVSASQWFKNLVPVLILAYTTNLVIVCLPYIINIVQKETQELYPKDANLQNQIQGTVSIVFNLPLGSIFITVFIFFLSIFYSTELNARNQIELFLTTFLTSLGSVGLGAWINSLTFILDSLGMPTDGISLYLTTLPFTAGFQSMVSAMLIATISFLITLACRGLLRHNWTKIVLHSAFIFLPILLIFAALKYYPVLPRIENKAKHIDALEIQSGLNIKVYSQKEPIVPIESEPGEDLLSKILRTKILRVGYDPNTMPFCFYNKAKKLVGYDVAFAIELAFDLDCSLEFIPLNHGNIGEELSNGLYDVGMSAISLTEKRLKSMCFTHPYLEGRIVFITNEKNRRQLASLDFVRASENLKIAVLKGSSSEMIALQEFPHEKLILLDNYEDFMHLPLSSILLMAEEQEAIAWAAAHPNYHVVVPNPTLGKDPLSYPIKYDAHNFMCYLDNWLKLKADEGFTEKQYNLWILGKTEEVIPYKPRWSIIHDVLGWTKE